jgi:hypothetical protein
MKKLVIILSLFLIALSCCEEPPISNTKKYDINFECKVVVNNEEIIPTLQIISLFPDLDYDLEASYLYFMEKFGEYMLIKNEKGDIIYNNVKYTGIKAKYSFVILPFLFEPPLDTIYNLNDYDTITFNNVIEGNYFVAVMTGCICYRKITVNDFTANILQKFVFTNDDPIGIFFEK